MRSMLSKYVLNSKCARRRAFKNKNRTENRKIKVDNVYMHIIYIIRVQSLLPVNASNGCVTTLD